MISNKILRIIPIVIVILFLTQSLCLAAPFWARPVPITATINDMWLDEDGFCQMQITVNSIDDEFYYFETVPDQIYIPVNESQYINHTLNVTVHFQNLDNNRVFGNGSYGYKIGDTISGDYQYACDEEKSWEYFYAPLKNYENFAEKRTDSNLQYVIILIIVIAIAIMIIALIIKKRTKPPTP